MKSISTAIRAPTVEELQRHVHRVLCQRERLEPEQTLMRTSVIRRGGRACGLFFQVEGPRLCSSYAVWAGDEHRILFYNSAGERAGEAVLSEAPDPAQLAA
jgi:hypothetical protein